MLVEVKVKTSRKIDNKTRKKTETYLLNDLEVFAAAELVLISKFTDEEKAGTLESYEIQSLRQSPIKEICTQFEGEHTYLATLKDVFHEDDGTEKYLRYKLLLWADNLTEANKRLQLLAKEGYDMLVEGLKEVDYQYLNQ